MGSSRWAIFKHILKETVCFCQLMTKLYATLDHHVHESHNRSIGSCSFFALA
jgi:hypothetical protein